MRIIIDAMGGDNAPEAAVAGACRAAAELGCDITLVGDEARVRALLPEGAAERVRIVHAAETVEMEDKALSAVMKKRDSSMSVALKLLSEGEGDALVSAGSTGALLTAATLTVKRIRGIRRAALGPLLPTKRGQVLLIDSGANINCPAEYLLQFAYMGHFYMKDVAGVPSPRIALLNNGTEETKGTEALQEAHALLRAARDAGRLNFIGNMEGRDIFSGEADVIVCDGFAGNIALKTVEGTASFLMSHIKTVFTKNIFSKLAYLLVRGGLREMRKMMDYKEVGGAPMLGLTRPVIKAHGSSDEKAFVSAVAQAKSFAESGFIAHMSESIDEMTLKNEKKD